MTNDDDLSKFIQLVKEDIQKFIEYLDAQNEFNGLSIRLMLMWKFCFESNFFRDFFNAILFNLSISHNELSREENLPDSLNKRTILLKKLFRFPENIIIKDIDYDLLIIDNNTKISLLYDLYHEVLRRHISTQRLVEDIVKEMHSEFMDFSKNGNFKIQIGFPGPVYGIQEEFYLNQWTRLLPAMTYYYIEDEMEEKPIPLRSLLLFDLKLNLNEKNNKLLLDEIKKIKLGFIIETFYFKPRDFVVFRPWYLGGDQLESLKKMMEFLKPVQDPKTLNNIKRNCDLIEKTKMIDLNDFSVIVSRLLSLEPHSSLVDSILSKSIILEIIFTKGMNNEAAFRFRQNGALFLAESEEELIRYYDILHEIYNIRSAIAHGGDWKKKVKKAITKLQYANEKEFIQEMDDILKKALVKILELYLENPNIMKEIEDFTFFIQQYEKNKNLRITRSNQ
ncbi:MAG: hypothetical protein ACFFAS_03815 [Promethearchaeota archaeon]